MTAAAKPPSLLYHFTGPTTSHLGSILASKQIRTTESNISSFVEHAGPDVVWLTDTQERRDQVWSSGSELKLQAVLSVELPAVRLHHWPTWAYQQGIDDLTYTSLSKSGGDPKHWWVTEQAVEHWHITGLALLPFKRPDGALQDFETFEGDKLSRLFRSDKAREALNLLPTSARR